MAYRDAVLADAPVGYWRLDETTGITAVDETGNGRDGTYHSGGGNTLGVAGVTPDPALKQDPRYGDCGVDLGFATNYTTECTLELWVRPEIMQVERSPHILGKIGYFASSQDDFPIHLRWSMENEASLILSAGEDYSTDMTLTSTPLLTGQWHHLVGVYRANGLCELYVNAGLAGSATAQFAISSNARSWTIGRTHEIGGGVDIGSRFTGLIDEAAIYDRALSASEIAAHFAATGRASYKVSGTVTADGQPAEATVLAYRFDNGDYVSQAISDPADGTYSITGLISPDDLMIVTRPAAGFRPLAHGPITPQQVQ